MADSVGHRRPSDQSSVIEFRTAGAYFAEILLTMIFGFQPGGESAETLFARNVHNCFLHIHSSVQLNK